MRIIRTRSLLLVVGFLLIGCMMLVGCGDALRTTEEEPQQEQQSEPVEQPEASDQSGSLSDAAKSQSQGTGESTSDKAHSISVQISIDTSKAKEYGYPSSMFSGVVSVKEGANVLDALKATGLKVASSGSYVSSINGLGEKQCGSGSGWLYFVNGVSPSSSCNKIIIHEGDSIRWAYTLNMGKDLQTNVA